MRMRRVGFIADVGWIAEGYGYRVWTWVDMELVGMDMDMVVIVDKRVDSSTNEG